MTKTQKTQTPQITWKDDIPFYEQNEHEPICRWYVCLAVFDGKKRLSVMREHKKVEVVFKIDKEWIAMRTKEDANYTVSLVLRLTELAEMLFFS